MTRQFDFSERLHASNITADLNRLDSLRVGVGGLWGLNSDLPVLLDDLLDVAMAVYVVDRLSKRTQSEGYWRPRTLSLQIPVAEVNVFESLRRALEHLLNWLTTDTWDLHFTAAVTSRRARPIGSLYQPEMDRPFVGLYSGGLDSLAGAVAQALDPAFASGVLVGGQSGNRLKALQNGQLEVLRARLPHLHWAAFQGYAHSCKAHQLRDWYVREQSQEKSQRSRAFLFLVFGAVTAHACGVDRLHVYENGVGAINLPYSAAFSVADQTRAMHPRTLLEAGALFSALFGQPFQIVNTSLWRTKGEMCAQMAAYGLGDLVNLTVSCDSHPLREAREQCGLCTSCLLRRLSLHAAGLRASDHAAELYRDDIYTRPEHPQVQDRPYQFMQRQAHRFEALTRPGQGVEFRVEFEALEEVRHAVAQMEGCSLPDTDARLADLYRRYALEFRNFSEAVRPRALELLSA